MIEFLKIDTGIIHILFLFSFHTKFQNLTEFQVHKVLHNIL